MDSLYDTIHCFTIGIHKNDIDRCHAPLEAGRGTCRYGIMADR